MMRRHCLRAVAAVVVLVAAGLPASFLAQTTPTPVDPADALFDDTVLQELRLTINPKDWQSLKIHYLDNSYYTCDLKWREQKVRNIAIRSRGTGSRSGAKPGLRVDFDYNVTDQMFLGLKSIILRNQTQDASNMHERLAMLFFRRMGLTASREAHARLYVNEVYAGLYTIVESVDKVFLKKTLKEEEGYLFKYDYNANDQPYYFDYRGSKTSLYVPLPFKPETHEDDPQPEKIAELVRIIDQDSEGVFRNTIAPYLDLEKFIDHIAVEMVLADNDGFNGNWGTNNFYFYRFEKKDLFTFIAWDKSNTFMDGPAYPIWHNIYDQPEESRNRLTMRALGFDDLKNRFLDKLLAYADALSDSTPVPTPFPTPTPTPTPSPTPSPAPTETPGWMEREVEREYAQIQDAVYADPEKPFTNEAFEKEVENLRKFARERGAFVRAEVAKARGEEPSQATKKRSSR